MRYNSSYNRYNYICTFYTVELVHFVFVVSKINGAHYAHFLKTIRSTFDGGVRASQITRKFEQNLIRNFAKTLILSHSIQHCKIIALKVLAFIVRVLNSIYVCVIHISAKTRAHAPVNHQRDTDAQTWSNWNLHRVCQSVTFIAIVIRLIQSEKWPLYNVCVSFLSDEWKDPHQKPVGIHFSNVISWPKIRYGFFFIDIIETKPTISNELKSF